ncbi:ABC transporter permease [Aneurinibacillus aneurinilyticus]|uniref:YhgE/Pip domain-containing protein n=1 Tax=Aneurinibacillus aneurinilyticus TaxID=1391 RepID=UPI002E20AB09|nr:ABC transporter permease [Aneurinibacillus aneurinilyticus]MED0670119.1 ABC transporter permease [Aneurinibacillus aneurinilyticus]
MIRVLQAYLKRPSTIVGIVTAVMFQVIFAVVWMTAYDGVTGADRLKQLEVGIVVSDQTAGRAIAAKLARELPVSTQLIATKPEAEQLLNERKLQMVITIPEGYSNSLKNPDRTAAIQYSINESNPALTGNLMQAIAAQVTATVNKEAVSQGLQAALVQAKLPDEQSATKAKSLSERVTSEFVKTNVVRGMNNQMAPMMLLLASYVGTMIMSMNIAQSSMALAAAGIGRWRLFAARNTINAVAAIFISLIGSSLLIILGGQAEHGFLMLWGFQSLFVLSFILLSQLFLLLFGMGGMLMNILLLSIQLVTSGAMMPRELLSAFYLRLGESLPAYYAVEGSMDLLFGGTGVSAASMSLLTFIVLSAGFGVLVVGLRKDRMQQLVHKSGGPQFNS